MFQAVRAYRAVVTATVGASSFVLAVAMALAEARRLIATTLFFALTGGKVFQDIVRKVTANISTNRSRLRRGRVHAHKNPNFCVVFLFAHC